MFVDEALGQSHKTLFGVNLLTPFCKLDHFINISNICCTVMKRSNLQNIVSKFMPKMFDEIDPMEHMNGASLCQGQTLQLILLITYNKKNVYSNGPSNHFKLVPQ
jgi:hypothetical protein